MNKHSIRTNSEAIAIYELSDSSKVVIVADTCCCGGLTVHHSKMADFILIKSYDTYDEAHNETDIELRKLLLETGTIYESG